MEKHKHHEPFFSQSIRELTLFLNENKKIDGQKSNFRGHDSFNLDLSHLSMQDFSGILPNESLFNHKLSLAASMDSVTQKEQLP